jgi:hypothetical protein
MSQPPKSSRGRGKVPAPELVTCVSLFRAIDGFVRTNANFESSIPVNLALEEIGKSVSLQEAFAIPLQRQLFNMDSALRWVLFMTVAPERSESEGDAPFSDGGFSSREGLVLIKQIYDIGVQDAVWEHFEDETDDEEQILDRKKDEK